ncbi:MAG: hypothetical protein IAE77_30265 [Prosthecobacter sp.]|jgi:hypothetical protein|uniref:protoglobin domain-containing protein n=1 Tax=Prosthecobacter sp. TaxID=1965333 RepID=UPI0019F4B178|nr:protoglobin domain-containing protein [Prosthecobacter sp.]MBE2287781.1 hypothetical protein [Prosthecobacter sp.]
MPSDTAPAEPWRLVLEKARALTGFTDEDCRVLQDASESLRPFGTQIATGFYDTLYAFPATAAVFKKLNQDRGERERTLRLWFESLVSGRYDDRFWTWHWLVGLIHVQHQVEHVFVVSMFGRLQTLLTAHAFEIFEEASAERVIQAFLRVTNCLAALAVEGYHQEYLNAVRECGLKEPVLNRMVAMEVQKKIQHYHRLLGPYPVS